MIHFNLKDEKYKNHPMDGKYGVVVGSVAYAGFPITIVDNSREVENGKYTDIPSLCLVHLSKRVREYQRLRIYNEFLYLGFSFGIPTYKMYEYKHEELSKEKIIQDLKTVLYYSEPNLQSRSMVGCSSDDIEDDRNYYEGYYVLNNEEQYTILKYLDTYKFYKGRKSFYPDWNKEEDLIYADKIDFNIYKKSLHLTKLRRLIVTRTNELLDCDDITNKIIEYKQIKDELETMFKIK